MFEYKVRVIQNALHIEDMLNEEASKGWRLNCVADRYLIFERIKDEKAI
jgi:hypothetical protein